MNNLAGSVYGEAFFELAVEKNKLDIFKKDLEDVKDVFDAHEDLVGLLENPNVTKDDKKKVIDQIFASLDKDSRNLLKVLIDKNRINIFREIKNAYMERFYKERQILTGVVYTTELLSQEELKKLEESLSKKYNKQVELKNEIDKKLIAGLSIAIDGQIIDDSVRAKLDGLRRSLKTETR